MPAISVGLGGALGACARYFIAMYVLTNDTFPYATLSVNLIGSFILGTIYASALIKNKQLLLFLTSGFLGAFTTFSSFSLETVQLFEQANYSLGFIYVATSIIGGLIFVAFGFMFGKKVANR